MLIRPNPWTFALRAGAVAIIDVFRAFTTAVVAFANGVGRGSLKAA